MLTEIRLEECELDCAMIGKRVRDARKAKKVTQEELSEHCGCTPTHICNLENGKIGVSLELLFIMRFCFCLQKSGYLAFLLFSLAQFITCFRLYIL